MPKEILAKNIKDFRVTLSDHTEHVTDAMSLFANKFDFDFLIQMTNFVIPLSYK